MAGQTISSDCDPPRGGGDHPAKKTIAPDTAPRLMQRKNSCFRPVNMLTGCPGIFSVFIFIIQFVVRKKC
ncbi:hypothetical protein B9S25_010060 [Escherichia coli O26:H11]|nr:hypothetical protein [Escherichia coli]QCH98805.1 hypothetical protein B9S25_010060 [Escherichia coli O26:H11]EFH2713768.1 hypothetical protein [Escherichia coli]EFI8929471.1 hypothetical protein [Escherichia coli]EFI9046651.1 hypothetical protein [Escherichia coli]